MSVGCHVSDNEEEYRLDAMFQTMKRNRGSIGVALVTLSMLGTCGCGDELPDSELPGNPPDSELPVNLQGVWLDRWSTSMGYQLATEMYDFDTGVWFKGYYDPWEMAPYQGFGISFGPNGAFTWVMGSNNADAGCKSYSIDFMKGSATVQDANTIRFRETQEMAALPQHLRPELELRPGRLGRRLHHGLCAGRDAGHGPSHLAPLHSLGWHGLRLLQGVGPLLEAHRPAEPILASVGTLGTIAPRSTRP